MKQFVTKNFLLIILILAVGFAFAMQVTIFQKPATTPPPTLPAVLPAGFAAYWQPGKAEQNTYQLEQALDGALQPGEATLTFAAVDFRTDTQVQSTTEANRDKTIPVLETNFVKTFGTGLSGHSLSTSTFTPINSPLFLNTLKVSMSGRDGFGRSYLQVNFRTNTYQVMGKSYAEQETDEAYTIPKAMLEDELWNRIRLDPDKLPTGDLQLIPATMTARLRHKRLEPLAAKAKVEPYEGVLFPGKFLKSYTIEYPTDDRAVHIIFENQFPYKIVGWEETYPTKDNLLTTRAVLKKTTQTDYRSRHTPVDSVSGQALTH
ncbi:hypothetical protein [Spirosoma aerophilum]